MPDITRIFKGIKNEFEVEIVFTEEGEESPEESHPYDEFVVVIDGGVVVRSGNVTGKVYTAPCFIHIPAKTEHQFMPTTTPTKVVVIHPNRS